MRVALELNPIDCCSSREKLLEIYDDIFLYQNNGILIGAVSINGHEIDDLIVANEFQHKGYGQILLYFAINRLQKKSVSPIILHVADWNKIALNLYLKTGFDIKETKSIKRTV